jgi:hypothetical protein
MKKIDKTKENIGVSGLDNQTRKKLFNEFVEAGGEVIKEKEDRGLSDYDRDLQKRYKHQLEHLRKQQKNSQNNTRTENRKTPSRHTQTEKPKYNIAETPGNINEPGRLHIFFQQLKIRFRLLFMKVTDFSGYFFTNTFFKNFDDIYKSSLISMQITFFNLFKQNLRTGHKITDSLDKMHPIYFELIELLSNVFDRTISNQIFEHFYNFQDVPQETREIQGPLTEIFIKLHPLYQYKELIQTGLERALTLQTRIEKKKFAFFSANKKKIKNDIFIIFNKLYPRLYWLMCWYEGRIFYSDIDIKDTIAIPVENIPGRRKTSTPNYLEYSFSENIFSKDNEKQYNGADISQEDSIPDAVKKGLALMQKIDQDKAPEIISKSSIFKIINRQDKVYLTSLLLDEFDREYSFILTTNKIKYNTTFKSSENLDNKNKFANLYNEIGKCKTRLKDYAEILIAFEKLKNEKPISSTQFIEYSNRLTALEKEKNQSGIEARAYIRTFMEKLCKELKILIDDMDKSGNIVVNPQDIIIFESAIEGDKKLNTRNVNEAITCTYNFSYAFIYRLSPGGDLSGDMETAGQDNPPEAEKKSMPEKENNKNKKITKEKNILKELDDLL